MTLKKFHQVLFNQDEAVCVADSIYRTKPYTQHSILETEAFKQCCYFTINPLSGVRCDANVTAYRNILVEFDKMPLGTQIEYIKEIGMPFSTCVFSGKKSYHFIISLVAPCLDRTEYDQLVNRAYKAVGLDKVDKANKNPSRFSRYPFHQRRETGLVQELKYVGARIGNDTLEAWLISRGFEKAVVRTDYANQSLSGHPTELSPWTRNFLMNGAPDGEWNDTLFKSASNAKDSGLPFDRFVELATGISDYLDKKDMATIRSAYKGKE